MMGLPNSEKILMVCLLVLTQFTNMTDTQTDTARRHRPHLCIASRGKNSKPCYLPANPFQNTILHVIELNNVNFVRATKS